jgi:hypothetical protein
MNHITVVNLEDAPAWNAIVTSFTDYDIYYLANYVKAFEIHGDGTPRLFYYASDALRGMCVVMQRDLAAVRVFEKDLPPNTFFDIITPYGYGGFLFEGDVSEENCRRFNRVYTSFLKEEKIVSEVVRYHPMSRNADPMRAISTVVDMGGTIHVDLATKEAIWENIASQNKNKIRKARKSGVAIYHGKDQSLFDLFIDMYNGTMKRAGAAPYYYFEKAFYESIHVDLHDHYEMFYAVHESDIVAMSIVLYANGKMHYHLSGSRVEYRHLAPSNLLLYEAACWGHDMGFKTFHLGGGVGTVADDLYKFKLSFNRNSDNRFALGTRVVDEGMYARLVDARSRANPAFDLNARFFPLYRSQL